MILQINRFNIIFKRFQYENGFYAPNHKWIAFILRFIYV